MMRLILWALVAFLCGAAAEPSAFFRGHTVQSDAQTAESGGSNPDGIFIKTIQRNAEAVGTENFPQISIPDLPSLTLPTFSIFEQATAETEVADNLSSGLVLSATAETEVADNLSSGLVLSATAETEVADNLAAGLVLSQIKQKLALLNVIKALQNAVRETLSRPTVPGGIGDESLKNSLHNLQTCLLSTPKLTSTTALSSENDGVPRTAEGDGEHLLRNNVVQPGIMNSLWTVRSDVQKQQEDTRHSPELRAFLERVEEQLERFTNYPVQGESDHFGGTVDQQGSTAGEIQCLLSSEGANVLVVNEEYSFIVSDKDHPKAADQGEYFFATEDEAPQYYAMEGEFHTPVTSVGGAEAGVKLDDVNLEVQNKDIFESNEQTAVSTEKSEISGEESGTTQAEDEIYAEHEHETSAGSQLEIGATEHEFENSTQESWHDSQLAFVGEGNMQMEDGNLNQQYGLGTEGETTPATWGDAKHEVKFKAVPDLDRGNEGPEVEEEELMLDDEVEDVNSELEGETIISEVEDEGAVIGAQGAYTDTKPEDEDEEKTLSEQDQHNLDDDEEEALAPGFVSTSSSSDVEENVQPEDRQGVATTEVDDGEADFEDEEQVNSDGKEADATPVDEEQKSDSVDPENLHGATNEQQEEVADLQDEEEDVTPEAEGDDATAGDEDEEEIPEVDSEDEKHEHLQATEVDELQEEEANHEDDDEDVKPENDGEDAAAGDEDDEEIPEGDSEDEKHEDLQATEVDELQQEEENHEDDDEDVKPEAEGEDAAAGDEDEEEIPEVDSEDEKHEDLQATEVDELQEEEENHEDDDEDVKPENDGEDAAAGDEDDEEIPEGDSEDEKHEDLQATEVDELQEEEANHEDNDEDVKPEDEGEGATAGDEDEEEIPEVDSEDENP